MGFGSDDEDRFFVARDEPPDRFGRWLGIVTVTDVDEVETSVGTDDRGGVVALAGLGVWAVQRMASVYLDAPVVGTLVEVTAGELRRQVGDVAIGLAFGASLRIGAPAASAVRPLREDPRLGPYATVWLVDTRQIDAEQVRVDEVEGGSPSCTRSSTGVARTRSPSGCP